MKPEQRLWLHVDRIMGARWRAQRHEDRLSPNIPDVSYSCSGADGWIELKVLEHWPAVDKPFDIPLSYLTAGQRDWLVRHGKHGSGRCFVLAKVGADYMLIRWNQLHRLGQWTRADWLWLACGFWQRRLTPGELAARLAE